MNKLMTWRRLSPVDAMMCLAGTCLAGGGKPGRRALPLLVAGLFVSACATATIEDAVPDGALVGVSDTQDIADPAIAATDIADQGETEQGVTNQNRAISSGGPEDTSEYPDLNDVQRGELAQMSPAEKSAFLARLNSARAEQAAAGGGAAGKSNRADLEKIARTHFDQVLRQIEEGDAPDKKTD